MLRIAGAIMLAYVVMFALVFVTFTLAYLAMGADGAFKQGTYEVSGLWLAASMILGLVAAVAGGYVCAVVGRSARAPLALAVVVLVIGFGLAFTNSGAPDADTPEVRADDVGNFEAMQSARQPTWLTMVNPVIGAIGVLIGGRLRG